MKLSTANVNALLTARAAMVEADIKRAQNLKRSQHLAASRKPGTGPRIAR